MTEHMTRTMPRNGFIATIFSGLAALFGINIGAKKRVKARNDKIADIFRQYMSQTLKLHETRHPISKGETISFPYADITGEKTLVYLRTGNETWKESIVEEVALMWWKKKKPPLPYPYPPVFMGDIGAFNKEWQEFQKNKPPEYIEYEKRIAARDDMIVHHIINQQRREGLL